VARPGGPQGAGEALFSEPDRVQMAALGVSAEEAARQVELFRHPPPFTHVLRPCRPGDGIRRIDAGEEPALAALWARAARDGRVSKLVPASGAATRMFKALIAELERHAEEDGAAGGESAAPGPSPEVETFFANLPRFAFFAPLAESLRRDPGARTAAAGVTAGGGGEPSSLGGAAREAVLRHLLTPAGLDYAECPKGLILFHRYPEGPRTPFEEHLIEAVDYARDGGGLCRLCFTVSPQHESGFAALLGRLRPALEERHGARFEVSFSTQRRATDTLAVDEDDRPFRLAGGSLLFRPGGHGALIANLQELADAGADLVLLKNIDNVVPDRAKPEVTRWKRLLTGLLLRLEERIAGHLEALTALAPEGPRGAEQEAAFARVLEEAEAFLAGELGRALPRERERREVTAGSGGGEAGARTRIGEEATGSARAESAARARVARGSEGSAWQQRRRALIAALDRPLRVCGVVRNTGEPGGGPFWVRTPSGEVSLQIVETSQLDAGSPEQQAALAASTHFNPVDICCGLRDRRGRPFDLARFVDPATVFIARKSHEGRPLKALERPGLWNGAMAGWNTVFVEVPDVTFAPVKTVLDLLRPEHQP
jgi:hypothetical protein